MIDLINDVGIVIQGPTNYYREILSNIDPRFNYVWSTWSTEPFCNIRDISQKMSILVNDKPAIPGLRNINLQCLSSYHGISYFKSIGTKWIVKIRSDMLWTGQEELIKRTINDIVSKNSIAAFLNYKPTIGEIHDFVSISNLENAEKIWSYLQTSPNLHSPECQLANHMSSVFNLNYSDLVNRMSFMNILMEENKVDLYCIKYNVSLGNQCNTDLFGVLSLPKKNIL